MIGCVPNPVKRPGEPVGCGKGSPMTAENSGEEPRSHGYGGRVGWNGETGDGRYLEFQNCNITVAVVPAGTPERVSIPPSKYPAWLPVRKPMRSMTARLS